MFVYDCILPLAGVSGWKKMIKYAKKAGPKTSLLNHIISLTIDFNAALQAGFSQSGILAGKPRVIYPGLSP